MLDFENKADLRAEMQRRRGLAFAANSLAGLTLAAWAPGRWFEPGRVISGYWPFKTEIDPRPLMQRFAKAGATLTLPVTPPKGSVEPLRFCRRSSDDALRPRSFGVHEPHPDAQQAEPDLLLVPLLAFDRRGGRLGYGAGHYDRTLEALRAKKSALVVGVAFAAQEIERVPMHAHDQKLDAILTERGLIEVSPSELC